MCYDCMCLMSLIWTMTPLSYDGEGTVNKTEHNRNYNCSPAGILGCLPHCLYLLLGYGWDDAISDQDK